MEYFNSKEKVFRAVVFTSKILITVLVGILAVINRYIDYILKHPVNLIEDSLMLATSSALAVVFVELSRLGEVRISHVIEIFFFFFTFNVLREFSGYFNFVEDKDLTEQQEKEKDPLTVVVFVVFGILAVIGIYIAIDVHLLPTRSMFAVYRDSPNPNGTAFLWFLFETIGFTLLTATAECYISARHFRYNTVEEKTKLIAGNGVVFFVFHVVFQLAGVYSLLK